MAHTTLKTSYSALADRINRYPQGAPPSDLLFQILSMLFSEEEAGLVSLMPIKPFTAEKASRIWKKTVAETRNILDALAGRGILVDIDRDGESVYALPPPMAGFFEFSLMPIKPFTAEKASRIWKKTLAETRNILDDLAGRGILVDIDHDGGSVYALPPPMAGFFEFSLMRVRDDIDQKVLSELFYQYLNVEEDFVRALFTQGETQLGRTFVHEPALSDENALHVLDYERASEVIETASHIGVGRCYCRHKMEHRGAACSAPQDICMTFNTTAASLTKHGIARRVEKQECHDLLQQAYEHNLVQFGENVREQVNFICNCCGCCCEAMIAARRFAILNPVHTTNFMPVIDEETCNGCGKCVNVCPVEAMTLVSANNPHKPRMKVARLNEEVCLGCGVCVRSCNKKKSLALESRPKRVLTPLNGTHRAVVMAIERGKLQNLIFDNQVLWSHRAMAGVLGVILKLPPVKQVLASKQLKSRYLESLLSYVEH